MEEQVTSPEAVDRVMEGAGVPRGPFRLMDLVGIDVNLAATEAVYAQMVGEDRYRPRPFQVMMREKGWLGRKSGRGFSDHGTPSVAAAEAKAGTLPGSLSGGLVKGPLTFQAAWRALGLAGRLASEPPEPGLLRRVADPDPGPTPPRAVEPETWVVANGTRQHQAALSVRWGRPVLGFDPALVQEAAAIFAPLCAEPVEDAYGHVFSRVVATRADEARRFGPRLDRDLVTRAVRLGVNQSRGPFEWLALLGARRVLGVHLLQAAEQDAPAGKDT